MLLIAIGGLVGPRNNNCLGSWGTLGCPFGASCGGVGRPFLGSGSTPGRVRRAVVAKDPFPFHPFRASSDFRTEGEPKRNPRGSQSQYKCIQLSIEALVGFLICSWCVFGFLLGGVWGPWTLTNDCIAKARCNCLGNHAFSNQFRFGIVF